MLKLALIEAKILQSPNWDLPFEIMCDASDYVVGAMLGQRVDKKPTAIWYVSKTLAEAQMNYTTTEKGAVSGGLRIREVQAYNLGKQDCHLYKSCNIKVLVFQEGGEAMIDTMGAASSRV